MAIGAYTEYVSRRTCMGTGLARSGALAQDHICIFSSIFGPKPVQILETPAFQPLEAALAATDLAQGNLKRCVIKCFAT